MSERQSGNTPEAISIREQVIRQTAEWIDRKVIAEIIVEHLEETEQQISLENAKAVWLAALENLSSNIGRSRL